MASARNLGSLTLDLVLKLGGFQAGMDQAARTTEKRLGEIEKRAAQFGHVVGLGIAAAATAAGSAYTALSALTIAAINNADALNDVSNRTGVAVEVLSGYAYAAKMTGTDLDTLSRGMKVLAKNAADALNPTSEQSKVFKALGISVVDTTGKLKALDKLVPEIADKFKRLEDGTTKVALAQALAGKSGTDLIEFFNSGSAGIDEFMQKAKELGVTISSQTASDADEFNDQLGDIKTLVQGVGLTIAAQLLPSLKNTATDFKEIIAKGDFVSNTVTVIDGAMKLAVGAINAYNTAVDRASIALGFFADTAKGISEVQKNVATFGFADGGVVDGINKVTSAYKEGQAALDALAASQRKAAQIKPIFADEQAIPESIYRKPAATATDPALGLRVQNALSNPKVDKSAENQAKKVAKAIREMADAQRDWQTELDGTGNQIVDTYAKRLDEITEKGDKFAQVGVPTEKVAAFRKEMEALAAALKAKELKEFQDNFDEQTLQIASTYDESLSPALLRYNAEVRDLEKTLKSGAITQEEYNKRIEALAGQRDSQATGILKDLQFEIELLGKTSEEQERLTLARQLGADAATAQGVAAIKALGDYQEAAKATKDQIDQLDAGRDSARGFFDDLKEGVGVWKSLSKAVDDFADRLYRLATDRLIEQLFGQAGTTSTGSSSGWVSSFAGLIGGLFGGGHAAGGSVNPGMTYRVNENRPELLSVGGSDYLMMGKSSGSVTPLTGSGRAGGGASVEVYVENHSGSQATVSESTGSDGQRIVKVLIDQVVGEVDKRIGTMGSTGRAISQRFGVNPRGQARG